MNKCPNHIEKFVEKLSNKNKFVEYEGDDYHIPYSVKCTCGSYKLKVFLNEEPSVKAVCTKCNNEIILYDLKFYPAATIVKCDEKISQYITPDGYSSFQVCVV